MGFRQFRLIPQHRAKGLDRILTIPPLQCDFALQKYGVDRARIFLQHLRQLFLRRIVLTGRPIERGQFDGRFQRGWFRSMLAPNLLIHDSRLLRLLTHFV